MIIIIISIIIILNSPRFNKMIFTVKQTIILQINYDFITIMYMYHIETLYDRPISLFQRLLL